MEKNRKLNIISVSLKGKGGFGYPITLENYLMNFYLLFGLTKLETSQDFPNLKVTLEIPLCCYPYMLLFEVNWMHSDSKWSGMIPLQPSIKLQGHLNATRDAFFVHFPYLSCTNFSTQWPNVECYCSRCLKATHARHLPWLPKSFLSRLLFCLH